MATIEAPSRTCNCCASLEPPNHRTHPALSPSKPGLFCLTSPLARSSRSRPFMTHESGPGNLHSPPIQAHVPPTASSASSTAPSIPRSKRGPLMLSQPRTSPAMLRAALQISAVAVWEVLDAGAARARTRLRQRTLFPSVPTLSACLVIGAPSAIASGPRQDRLPRGFAGQSPGVSLVRNHLCVCWMWAL